LEKLRSGETGKRNRLFNG